MSNNEYEVCRDFLPVRTALGRLSPSLGQKVEEALGVLKTDPRPAAYNCREVRHGFYALAVVEGDEEVSLLYSVNESGGVIELIEIKSVSGFRKLRRTLDELLKFGP